MSEKKCIEKLISCYYRRLHKLREQQALRGQNADVGLEIEIEDIEEKIRELQKELQSVSESPVSLTTTPVTSNNLAIITNSNITIMGITLLVIIVFHFTILTNSNLSIKRSLSPSKGTRTSLDDEFIIDTDVSPIGTPKPIFPPVATHQVNLNQLVVLHR